MPEHRLANFIKTNNLKADSISHKAIVNIGNIGDGCTSSLIR